MCICHFEILLVLLLNEWVHCLMGVMFLGSAIADTSVPPILDSFTDVAAVGSAVLFIFSILGLSQQESARAGNW